MITAADTGDGGAVERLTRERDEALKAPDAQAAERERDALSKLYNDAQKTAVAAYCKAVDRADAAEKERDEAVAARDAHCEKWLEAERRVTRMQERGKAAEARLARAQEALEAVKTALPVLRTMCRVACLPLANAKATEMMGWVDSALADSAPAGRADQEGSDG